MARLLIGGVNSGSGKTTVCCALKKALADRGVGIFALKCGPDYIDGMYGAGTSGVRTGNLDGYMLEEEQVKERMAWCEEQAELVLAEGVMGYYDGLGFGTRAGTYELAAVTGTPAVLVVDAKGMAASLGAVLKGFISYRRPSGLRGVIFNRLAPSLYAQASSMAVSAGLVPLGYLPERKELSFQSRHLGLMTPEGEQARQMEEKIGEWAVQAEETLELDALLRLAREARSLSVRRAGPLFSDGFGTGRQRTEGRPLRLAVARDAAFCFLYEDNLQALQNAGIAPVFFSPLKGEGLPREADGVYLCGGYPELYLKELAGNEALRAGIGEAFLAGMPVVAEGGGYLYLHETLSDENGRPFRMAGILPDGCGRQKRLQNFGYHTLRAREDSLLFEKGDILRVHEFHYYAADHPGEAFELTKAGSQKTRRAGFSGKNFYGGFPHLYFPASEKVLQRLAAAMEAWRREWRGKTL